ncbi:AMP-binding protein [Streptomyces bambusae]|uniref:non-ribosomal peptide synthetase n=1 Tax=Streptomyces bambusae TaxID=1550616 RepID=UPI001CFCB59B|nr:AMP-binding protein [Streptomyces bambusae]MCB5168297.1 AMP-binding protein [Streptomyces bambusae]
MRSFGASSAHKGMWRAQEMAPDTPNHALTMWDVDGELDAAVMESAFLHVMAEAEVLRVNFVDDGSGLRLVPRELGDWRPFLLDLRAEADPEQAARDALSDLVRQPFDLARDLLFRLGTVKLADDRSLLVIAYHHLISDGFGAGGLLSKRLADVYTALLRGEAVPAMEHPWDAESFAAEAVEYLASEKFTEDSAYWRDYLKDAPAPAQVPRVALSDAQRAALSEPTSSADRWSAVAETIGMVSRTVTVPRAEADVWTETATANGLWMSQLVTAAAAVFFRHRCDRPEFLISLAVGNRVGVAARTPGLAVNVIPVRVKVPLGATFTEVAEAIVDDTYDILGHAALHYSDIQRAAGTVLSGRGSFGAVVNVVEFAEQLRFGDSPARYSGATTGTFEELSIGVYTDGSPDSDLYIRLDAPANLYHRSELRFIGEELVAFLRAVVAGADRPVGALDVVAGDARDLVLKAPQAVAEQPGQTVAELFARQVGQDPLAVALADGDTEVSYRELDERSGRTAATLRARQAGPETVVAVALPRSAALVAALLGVVKTGAAYLPLDPAAGTEQLAAAAAAGSARILITDAATAAALPAGADLDVVLADAPATDAAGSASHAPAAAHPDGLLALVPGSGAGAAVALTHRNLLQFVTDGTFGEAAGTVLWHSPHTSQALALELWVPLLRGGTVVLAPEGDLGTEQLAALQAAHGITAVWLPAGRFLAVAGSHPERLAGFREVWTGGDRVPAAALRRVREACPGLTVVNGHGAAETTAFAASHRLSADASVQVAGAVGGPLDHAALYVLGPGLAPVPVGVDGELYVAGPGVARGYAGLAGTTAERFVACPFGTPGGVMYRTGDRVRWGAEGRLEYVGRADTQTDVRGVRVELAEVEEVLSEYTGLAQSVLAVHKDAAGQQRLVAYVVPAAGQTVSVDELRRFAAGWLPENLVPSVFTVLETLPVTADGRVDRAALPEPELDERKHRAPRNETETVLARLFAEVLEIDKVGIDEDFFDLGGNSLRAIRLVGLIRSELKQEVSIRRLFAARTIIGLSDIWKDLAQARRPSLSRRTKAGAVL